MTGFTTPFLPKTRSVSVTATESPGQRASVRRRETTGRAGAATRGASPYLLSRLRTGRAKEDEHGRAGDPRTQPVGGVEPVAPSSVLRALDAPGTPLDAATRGEMEPHFGCDFSRVRIHTDAPAADSARAVNARAYTVGQDVVFGSGQYAPGSPSGRRLLAHELVHTLQQGNVCMPSAAGLKVSSPDDAGEQEAGHLADSVVRAMDSHSEHPASRAAQRPAVSVASPLRVARLQRVISFTTAPGRFTTTRVAATEEAGGFRIGSAVPTFQWQPDVTIHGDATDTFADWEVAHHQVGKADWLNVWWGTGPDRTHRHQTITGGFPIRDATAAGNTWYSDWRAQGFGANGDVRSPIMRDTPGEFVPWANPIAGRGGTRGWFNFGLGFVSTLSARHIPDGTGAAAFRHLNHVHWNFSVSGTFNMAGPIPGRVTLNGGAVNHSKVIPGFDTANPPMHGTPLFADNIVNTDT